ncbi:MAG: Druantia anti-phage system protein DruA [Steroidobacteraceae bacterium]
MEALSPCRATIAKSAPERKPPAPRSCRLRCRGRHSRQITPRYARSPKTHVSTRTKRDSRLWNEYIQRYHYLGYNPLPGAQLRYFVAIDGQFVALLGFGAAAWKTAPRDQFIGWTEQQRRSNMHLIVNNARFLILPWVQSKGLASKILGRIARQLPTDWQRRYGYRPVLLESFVQSDRFRGTCYKAANWLHVGQTTGRGKLDVTHQYAIPVKDIWLYPLQRSFRQALTR